MLSPRVISRLQNITNNLYVLGIIPFAINQRNAKFVAEHYKGKHQSEKRGWCQPRFLWIVPPACYQLFYCYQFYVLLIQNEGGQRESGQDQTNTFAIGGWLLIFWVGYSWTFTLIVNFWLSEKEIANFFCKFLVVDGIITKETGLGKQKIDFANITCIFFKWLGIIFASFLVGVHLINPGYMQYLTSVSGPFGESPKLFIALVILDSVTISYGIVMMLYELLLQSLYLISTSKCLAVLRTSNLPFLKKTVLYTQLRLTNQLQEHGFRRRIPHLTIVLGLSTIIGCIGLIHYNSSFGLFDLGGMLCFAVGGCVIQMGMLHCFGCISSGCQKLIGNLRQEVSGNKGGRRIVSIMQPFGIRDGPVRVMTYNGMYHISGAMINMLVTILVLIGHN